MKKEQNKKKFERAVQTFAALEMNRQIKTLLTWKLSELLSVCTAMDFKVENN